MGIQGHAEFAVARRRQPGKKTILWGGARFADYQQNARDAMMRLQIRAYARSGLGPAVGDSLMTVERRPCVP